MVIASLKDRFANSSAQAFMKSADPLIPIKYVPIPIGGHNIGVWKPFVATGFLWISGANEFLAPAPAPAPSPKPSASGSQK
jgi:hypothetical protein